MATNREKQINKMTMSRFNQAPPGYSFTRDPKKMPWRKPPKFTDPAKAVDALIDSFEQEHRQGELLKAMMAGVAIETLVTSIVKQGFSEGAFTVDLALIIQAPLTYYLMGLAADAGVPARVYATKDGLPRTKYGMQDAQILNLMRKNNPDFAEFFTQVAPQREEENMMRENQRLAKRKQGFLGMESEAPAAPEDMGENIPEDMA